MNKETKRLIKSFQTVLTSFEFEKGKNFSENFAIARFKKKFQKPDPSRDDLLHQETWVNWLNHDGSLPQTGKYFYEVFQKNPSFWYEVRTFIRKNLRPFKPTNTCTFTSGSTFTSMGGQNSVEAKLCSTPWDCTYDNFERFSVLCYRNAALKKAFRRRWGAYCRRTNVSQREYDTKLYERVKLQFGSGPGLAFTCFQKKLTLLVNFVEGSRFETIPKNNSARRPINVEPLCNVLTQKQIGDDLRNQIKSIFKIDLDTLAMYHHSRISDPSVATIDLKNASDSFSQELIHFLMPPHYLKHLNEARSPYILGPDEEFYYVNKISAMGNGFTFELMSFLLTVICYHLDRTATVFGDDIIIQKDKGSRLISLLTDIGLIINLEKSFLEGPFRESCGGNFHDTEGYIESFDFEYPESIGDCIVIYNKAKRLSSKYYSFYQLERELYRQIPPAWRGGPASFESIPKEYDIINKGKSVNRFTTQSIQLDGYFRTGDAKSNSNVLITDKKVMRLLRKRLKSMGLRGQFNVFLGSESYNQLRSSTVIDLQSYQWAKYLMYLYAGRRTDDVIVGKVLWNEITFVSADGRAFRLDSLLNP